MKRLPVIIMFLVISLTGGLRAAAQQSGEMERLRREIAQYEADIKACNDLIAKSKKNQSTTESQLKIVRTQLAKRREMVGTLEKQVGAIEREISGRRSDISRLQGDLETLRRDYAEMVYAAWKNHKYNDFLLFLFSADDFNAATRRTDFMRRYNRARQDKAGQIASLSDTIRNQVSELDATRTELDATRQTHTREASSLAKDEKQHSANVKKLAADQKDLRKQISEKEALRKKVQAQIDELIAAEVRRAQGKSMSEADLRALAELSGRFDQNMGKLPYPISGGVIVDRFGEHAHAVEPGMRVNNKGVNIAGSGGAAVKCVFEGEVVVVSSLHNDNRYKIMIVRHGSYFTLYANLVSTSVRMGDKVAAGQTLGRIGNNPENNALHFEIHREAAAGQSTPLNPEQWLRR